MLNTLKALPSPPLPFFSIRRRPMEPFDSAYRRALLRYLKQDMTNWRLSLCCRLEARQLMLGRAHAKIAMESTSIYAPDPNIPEPEDLPPSSGRPWN